MGKKKIGKKNIVDLHYLSLSGLHKVVDRTTGQNICTGCFGGKYPI